MNLKDWIQAKERRRYWETAPSSALAWLGLTAFLAFGSMGLSQDLATSLRWPFWWILAKSAFYGLAMAFCFVFSLRNPKRRNISIAAIAALAILLPKFNLNLPVDPALLSEAFQHVRQRLTVDGLFFNLAATLGWVILVVFAGTQGVKYVRDRTELELAEKLQQTLAPPLSAETEGYEIRGRSQPSSQMGGDLLDVVKDGPTLACYIGDVAGHGIQAGVFMAMVKSSARTALLRHTALDALLSDLNQVLVNVKAGSSAYVTFAGLQCDASNQVRYTLAGHGPLVHYRARSRSASLLQMEQFPVGLFGHATFESRSIELEPGDIVALLTDGLVEVTNANDEEFGFDRIGEILREGAGDPLDKSIDKLFAAARSHGRQHDDETVVLVRRRV